MQTRATRNYPGLRAWPRNGCFNAYDYTGHCKELFICRWSIIVTAATKVTGAATSITIDLCEFCVSSGVLRSHCRAFGASHKAARRGPMTLPFSFREIIKDSVTSFALGHTRVCPRATQCNDTPGAGRACPRRTGAQVWAWPRQDGREHRHRLVAAHMPLQRTQMPVPRRDHA